MRFSIIIPAYNEEKILGKVLDDVKNISWPGNHEAEVIVVDDGSTDKTPEIAGLKGVRVLRHKKNRGYGAALKSGIDACENEVIAILDGDGSYPVGEITSLLQDIDKHDMVIGARVKKGAEIPLSRKIVKYLLTKLAEYLVSEEIPDINSGLRIFRKSVYKKYVNLLPDNFSFTLTITLASIQGREKVKFTPIDYSKRRGESKIRPVYDTISFFFLIIRTILYFNPIRVLVPMAAIFIFAGLALGLYSILIMGVFLDVTVTILLIFGFQLIVLGLIADLINRRVK